MQIKSSFCKFFAQRQRAQGTNNAATLYSHCHVSSVWSPTLFSLTERLHGTIVGPTGRSDPGYVRLVGPTGQSDDQSRCSVGGIIIS